MSDYIHPDHLYVGKLVSLCKLNAYMAQSPFYMAQSPVVHATNVVPPLGVVVGDGLPVSVEFRDGTVKSLSPSWLTEPSPLDILANLDWLEIIEARRE